MYDFNLLVSYPWAMFGRARREATYFLKLLGDQDPVIERTLARGILGVKTCLDSRVVIKGLRTLFASDPVGFQYTLKWVPVDRWTSSDIESMREVVLQIRNEIGLGERWRMTVEKRRYSLHHKIDIINALAELIDEKVDLKEPDRILRVDIIGKYAGLSFLLPDEVFSTARLPL